MSSCEKNYDKVISMSDKRFQLDIGDDYCFINDKIENKTYAIYNDRFKERWGQEIVDLLNEQQDTIGEQKIAIDELITDYKKLEKENEKLIQKKCLPCELVNLQTREIDKLKKENEQLKDENERLRLELETHKHPLWSTREAEKKVNELSDSLADEIKKNGLLNEELNQLRIENMRLKKKCGGW